MCWLRAHSKIPSTASKWGVPIDDILERICVPSTGTITPYCIASGWLYSIIHPIAHVMTSQSLNCVLAHVSGSFLCLSLTLISKAKQFFFCFLWRVQLNAHRHSSDAVCRITLCMIVFQIKADSERQFDCQQRKYAACYICYSKSSPKP